MSECINEYLGSFEEKEIDPVYLMALEFAYRTELFDRRGTHEIDSRDGVSNPAPWRLSICNNNAIKTRREIISKYCLDRDSIIRFNKYDKDLGLSLEELQRLMDIHKDELEKIQPEKRKIDFSILAF
jgi:hypothetical protein